MFGMAFLSEMVLCEVDQIAVVLEDPRPVRRAVVPCRNRSSGGDKCQAVNDHKHRSDSRGSGTVADNKS